MTAAPPAATGLELFDALLRRELEPPPMAQLMGIELVEAAEGRIAFESDPEHRFYNPLGSAVHTTLAPGESYTTLSLEVKYARPITVDTGTVRVVGEVEQRSRRQATASARLTAVATGKLLAHGTTTCIIVGP